MSNIKINMDSLDSSNFKKTIRHKVQVGENVLRFLPPFGEASNGAPFVKWGVIWGFKDPTTGRQRPYVTPSTYSKGCPVYDYLDKLKPRLEDYKQQLTLSGLSEDQIKEQMKPLNDFVSNIRPKTVFSWNAVDKSGKLGVIDLKKTAHDKVVKLVKEYINDYGQDPTSLNSDIHDSGVWFKITREGKGFDTSYDAFKNQLKVKNPTTGVLNYEDDRSSLPENIVENYNELGYDLTSLYTKLTYEELKEVLDANLYAFAKETGIDLILLDGEVDTSIEIAQSVDQSSSSLPQGNTKVNLNLGDDIPDNSQSQASNTPSTGEDDLGDVMALADQIFNS